MTETIIPIPARLRSSVVGGHVTGAADIYDDSKEQDQQTINAAVDSEIGTDSTSGTIKGRIKALEESIGPGGSVEEQINAKVATLDATVSQTASTDGLALQVTEVDGKLTGVTGSIAANTYDAHGAAATAKSELLGDAASDYNTLGKLEDKIQAEATARGNEDTALDGRLDTIEGLIPSQATTTNQLADKSFVNSSISTATATFRGSENLVSDLSLPVDATESQIATALATAISTADSNDYAFVQVPTSATTPTQIARVDRYKYNGTAWAFEYSINNSGYTAEQWAAINSGITSNLVTAFGAKYDLPSGGMPSTDMSSAVQTSLGKADTAYQKPSAGIPDTDLSSAVQTSLGKADTALQSVPTASASVLGGVKVGTNLSIDANGVLSATDTTYSDFVGSGSSHAHGLVPDPGATAGTTKYLREDGTWAVPAGGGGSTYTAGDGIDITSDTISVKAGSNLSFDSSGNLNATDTTYTSQQASQGGTDVSLVTTGEKYTWNQSLPTPIDLLSLSADYTFKEGDTIIVGTGLYKCTAETTTLPPFNFVFDANGSIVIDSINGYEAVVVDSDTLNTGWEKIMDVSDRHYVEMRLNTKADKATTLAGYNIGDAYTKTQIDALTRHTRLTDFDLNDLKKAVADQNLEKYGLKVGDEKTINGHTYVIAGLNPMKGTSTPYRLTQNHVGLIVIPHTTQVWNASGNTYTGSDGRGAGYANCDLHYYLVNTLLPLVKGDLGATNLIAHSKLLSNAVNQNGYNKRGEASGCSSGWGWVADQYICALSEVQVYGSAIWSSSSFDTGEACRQLEVFQKYSHTEIFGNEYPWLRDVVSASRAAYANTRGDASNYTASTAYYVAALILFH